MFKVVLSMLPAFQSVNLLVPHMGIACLKAYINEKLPNIEVKTLDLRPFAPKREIWCPSDTPKITIRKNYVSDIYELPIIASAIYKYQKHKNIKDLLEPEYKVIYDWSIDRSILPETTMARLKITNLFALKHLVKYGGYDLVGFSLYVSNLYLSIFMAMLIKLTYPNTKIVFGGPQVTQSSSTRELLLKSGIADYLVLGEGEQPIVDIIKSIQNNEPINNEIGIKTIENIDKLDTFYQEADLESLPTPNYDDLDFSKYLNSAIPIYSNRGCTFRCHFCSEFALFGKKFKRRSPDKLLNDMKKLNNKHGINSFYFCDSLINASIGDEWLEDYTNKLINQNLNFKWYGRFRAELDNEIIIKMKNSGLITSAMGVESFSDITLKNMNKQKQENTILKTIYSLIENDIKASINLFVGYPGETESDFMKTFEVANFLYNEFNKSNKLNYLLFTIRTFELRPFSSIYNNTKKFGIEVDTWRHFYTADFFPKELESVFNNTYYSFKVNNVSISDALHRGELLSQIRFRKDIYEAEV